LIAKKRTDNRRGPTRSERAEDKGGVLGDYGLSEEQGNEIIMAARAHWFDDEPEAGSAAAPQTGEAADADPAQ
jgi:transcription termination/antitermination protein NusA